MLLFLFIISYKYFTLWTFFHSLIYQLSVLRVIACIAIVVLHTTFAANEYFIDTLSKTEDVVSRAFEHNMIWGVPVFLMVTGALLYLIGVYTIFISLLGMLEIWDLESGFSKKFLA